MNRQLEERKTGMTERFEQAKQGDPDDREEAEDPMLDGSNAAQQPMHVPNPAAPLFKEGNNLDELILRSEADPDEDGDFMLLLWDITNPNLPQEERDAAADFAVGKSIRSIARNREGRKEFVKVAEHARMFPPMNKQRGPGLLGRM